ncbi:MAG: thermonuclease family protein [Kiritimatiellales bacterium]|nr:thermonuclease family protein [Kiritimatiellales bacterium]
MKNIALVAVTILLVSCQATSKTTPPLPSVEEAIITRVVDGDTLTILLKGKMEYVRIIGIDAPEKDECFYTQATEQMKSLTEGKRAILESKTDENRDKYDRLLRYVSVDGIDVGGQMIFEGFAKNYPWFPHPRNETYDAIEREAKKSELGLWEKCKN